jgi:anti-anti-sigma factor
LPLLDRLGLGDHICWMVDDEAVRLESLTEGVRTGLREGQRILYCGDDARDVVATMDRRGLRAGEAVASGALRTAPIGSSYLDGGVFDPAAALCFLRREIDDARRAGHEGLRVITDMSWASRPVAGIELLPRYEAEANAIFVEGYALGVCAYDPRIFGPPSLSGLACAHAGTIGTDAPFNPDLVLRIRRTCQPFGLRLEGEADVMNQLALSAAIDHLLAGLPDGRTTATVDVSGLRFIDTAAARILVQALDHASGQIRIIGRPPAVARLLDVRGTGRTSASKGNPG